MADLNNDREVEMSATVIRPSIEDDSMKAKKLASDRGLIERLRTALSDVKVGKTVSLSKLSKSVSQRRKEISLKSRA